MVFFGGERDKEMLVTAVPPAEPLEDPDLPHVELPAEFLDEITQEQYLF